MNGRPGAAVLRVGDWRVDPSSGQISRGSETAKLDMRAMRLLACLAERAGQVVSIDELLDEAWAGVTVSQDSVYQAIASLRRLLGDDSREPKYIETVPRLGYRMVASVSEWRESAPGTGGANESAMLREELPLTERPGANALPARRLAARAPIWLAGAAGVCLLLAAGFAVYGKIASANRPAAAAAIAPPQGSIAVLPFLDLTEGMHNEEFADGMTEELIDRLSRIPGLRVPAPTQSFYFKGKQVQIAEMAKTLGVTYLLDGSVRKSGSMVRVAARLLRADDGYVMWTESYDRPFNDILAVQDDIAGKVAAALKTSIGAGAEPAKSK